MRRWSGPIEMDLKISVGTGGSLKDAAADCPNGKTSFDSSMLTSILSALGYT